MIFKVHMKPHRVSRRFAKQFQAGQSATELLVIFPALILLVFGVIQFGLLYQARSVLNHATFLAARAGAMHNGSKTEMRLALAKGMTLYLRAQPMLRVMVKLWSRPI